MLFYHHKNWDHFKQSEGKIKDKSRQQKRHD